MKKIDRREMDRDTLLIVGALVIGGVAIYGLTKPVGQSLNDVTGVIPWTENVITKIGHTIGGIVHLN